MKNKTSPAQVMLVDDNTDVLRLFPALLRNLAPVTVECHSSAQSALAAFAAAPTAYELVITDLAMPDMNGLELCREVRTISREQKVMLATGSAKLTAAQAQREGFAALLLKPFPVDSLRRALAAVGLAAATSYSA